MAEFAERDVVTIQDYELYCHYVAGLVGIGLSHMFARSGLESKSSPPPNHLSPPPYHHPQQLSNPLSTYFFEKTKVRSY